jgi:acylpyruvate hydrolase
MVFTPVALVEYLSSVLTLETGDLIFTGTPSGVGVARKPPRFLTEGDLVEVTIESLGTIRNRCHRQSDPRAG